MFLTVSSTPRRDRRVLAVTLGHHHKPFLWLGVGGDRTHARTYVRACVAGWLASVPSICLAGWSERSTRCGAHSSVGRAKKALIRMGERYATGTAHQRVLSSLSIYGAREA